MSNLDLTSDSDHYDGPEIWRVPPDAPPVYEISTHGRWRTKMNVTGGRKRTFESTEWREYTPACNHRGYQCVTFYDLGGKERTKYLHRLVLEAFVGPMPAGMHLCRHLDDDRSVNHLANLAFGTHADNANDRKLNRARRRLAGLVR